jgi:hypothetical protein
MATPANPRISGSIGGNSNSFTTRRKPSIITVDPTRQIGWKEFPPADSIWSLLHHS